jgi:hypothetical protein
MELCEARIIVLLHDNGSFLRLHGNRRHTTSNNQQQSLHPY